MIGKLQGIVDYIGDNYAIVMVGASGAVGYRVFCSPDVLAGLKLGEFATLWIETNVREDHIHLYGFESRTGQDLFLRLTSVSGVGPKLGMAILGAFKTHVLQSAIASGDTKTLSTAPGVGKKVAERIVLELKGKFTGAGESASALVGDTYNDLLSALETLGYRRADVLELAQKLVKENPDADVAKLVPLALKGIMK